MVEEKSPSWVKHAVRRWKQLYHEIQYADGQLDISNPLSEIFRNEALTTKLMSTEDTETTPDTSSSKKEESPPPQPEKQPISQPEKKQSKKRFLFKIKELQFLPNFISNF